MRAEPNVLTGRLVSEGRPLGGVKVEVWRDLLLPTVVHLQDAVTDRAGYFAFLALDDGIHGLIPKGPDIPRGYWKTRVIIEGREDLHLGEIEIPASASLSGRVVDPDGRPLAGVTVLDSPGQLPGFDRAVRDIGLPLFETVTDREGRFTFEGVVSGQHQVLAESQDHADRKASGNVEAGGHLDVGTIQLAVGITVIGRVVDGDGAPVAGAQVQPHGAISGQVVEGVRTGEAGEFQLRGLGQPTSLRVKAEGFAQTDAPVRGTPMTIRLERSWALTGRVEGSQGRETRIEIKGDLRNHVPLLAPAHTMSLPVRGDGSFRIEGLAPTGYSVRAFAEGYGASKLARVGKRDEPVLLTIETYPRANLVARDDLGRPVTGAEVIQVTNPNLASFVEDRGPLLRGWIQAVLVQGGAERRGTTDPEGRAGFIQDPMNALGVVVTHPDLLPAGASFEPGTWPDPLEVILQRPARLTGRVTNTAPRAPTDLGVRIVPADATLERDGNQDVQVDGEGRFHVEQISPGRYDVTLFSAARSIRSTAGQAGRIPVLGQGMDESTTRSVELVPGETTELVLEAKPMGTIRGRVLQGNEPVAGAIVFRVPGSANISRWDREEAHASRPFTTTGHDGSYLFLYSQPGSWQLRIRHPDSPVSFLAETVEAPSYGMEIQRDLSLRASTVVGAVDPAILAETREEGLLAYLFSLDGASEDLFPPMMPVPYISRFKSFPIDEEGAFRFPFVPEGAWVLRLIAGGRRLVSQTMVRTGPDAVTDLGVLRAPVTVDIEFLLELPPTSGLSIPGNDPMIMFRRTVPGRERGIFVKTMTAVNGRIRVEGLVPDTYELELNYYQRPRATLLVHPDGTVEPSVLSFR